MMISAEEWWVNIKSLNDNQKYWGRTRTRGFVKLGFCWVISLFVCYSASHLPLWLSSNQGRVLSSARPYLSTKGSGRRWEHNLLLCLVEPVCLLTKYDGKQGCCTSHLWGEMVCRCVSRSDQLWSMSLLTAPKTSVLDSSAIFCLLVSRRGVTH